MFNPYIFDKKFICICDSAMTKLFEFAKQKQMISYTDKNMQNPVVKNKPIKEHYRELKNFQGVINVPHAVISIGAADILNEKFDVTDFEFVYKKIIHLLANNFGVNKLFLCLVNPMLDNVDVKYWRRLEEINRSIYFLAIYNDNCNFVNCFSTFVQRKKIYTHLPWFNYVYEGEILYNIKLDNFQKLDPVGKLDQFAWSEAGNFRIAKILQNRVKKATGNTIFTEEVIPAQNLKKPIKSNSIDKLLGVDEEPIYLDITASRLDEDILDSSKQDELVFLKCTSNPVLPVVTLMVGDEPIEALIDSGASHVLINENKYETLKQKYPVLEKCEIPMRNARKFSQATGPSVVKITKRSALIYKFQDATGTNSLFHVPVFVTKDLNSEVLFGRNALNDLGADISMKKNCLKCINPQTGVKFKVQFSSTKPNPHLKIDINASVPPTSVLQANNITCLQTDEVPDYNIQTKLKLEEALSKLDGETSRKLREILLNHLPLFEDRIGKCSIYEHEFEFESEPKNIWCKTRHIPHRFQKAVQAIIQQWIESDVVEECPSTYKVGLVNVDKGGGKVRPCGDFQPLNKYMKMHSNEVPNIQHLMMIFRNKKWFTTLDFNNGFLQIPLKNKSRKYCSFVHEGRSYVFKRVPYGTKDSMPAFIIALQKLLGDLDFVSCYVDDVLIHSETLEEHIQHIKIVLDRIRRANMTLNITKSKWCQTEIKYLGLIINSEGCTIDREKIQSILDFKVPQNIKELQSFVGLFQYYRNYIPNLAEISAPLYQLQTVETKNFKWTPECQQAYDRLKTELSNAVLLHFPDFSKEFIVYTDASTVAVAGVVMQEDEDERGKCLLKPLAFTSRVLKEHEKHYSIMELELLAIINTLVKNYYMLIGQKIRLYTDNKALTYLRRNEILPNRIIRWLLYLENFQIEIHHISGASNTVADSLSRYTKLVNKKDLDYFVFLFNHRPSVELKNQIQRLGNYQKKDERLQMFVKRQDEKVCFNNELRLYSYKGNDGIYRIYIPAELQAKLIDFYHNQYGHVGITKLIGIIRRTFDWPDLTVQITDYTNACVQCQWAKRSSSNLLGPMTNLSAQDFNDTICLDFFGPLPKGRAGLEYILVIEDLLTKYVKLYPMKNATSKNTIEKIERWIQEFGPPKNILSDNGPQFRATRYREHFKTKNINLRFTSRYTPSSNPAERIMATIGQVIRVFIPEKQRKWPELIADIENKLNYTENATTKAIPHEVVKGTVVPDELADIVIKNRKIRADLKEFARKNFENSARKRAAMLQNQKHSTLSIGTLVLIKNRILSDKLAGVATKLSKQWLGPFKIIRQRYPNVYEMEEIDNPGNVIQENIRHLRVYKAGAAEKTIPLNGTPSSTAANKTQIASIESNHPNSDTVPLRESQDRWSSVIENVDRQLRTLLFKNNR